MLRTNLWTITMQNVSGIKKWNYEKLPLNFAMQFPFPFPVIPGNNNVSFPFPKCGNGISIPVPKNWEWNFHSRYRNLGMEFAVPNTKVQRKTAKTDKSAVVPTSLMSFFVEDSPLHLKDCWKGTFFFLDATSQHSNDHSDKTVLNFTDSSIMVVHESAVWGE